MSSVRPLQLAALAALATACGGATSPKVPHGSNVIPFSVNGATCRSGGGAYPNQPCVRVTVCLPGSSTCALIDDLLLDTGSYGLRIFKEVLPFSLPLAAAGTGTLAECVQYLDGTSDWGPVATADVLLGGEPTIRIPVHVIDATFATVPATCTAPEPSAAVAGFNGILGVGLFAEDCGAGCAGSAANGVYFSCGGGVCRGTTVPVSDQVPNPVARLPVDNNGVIVVLPSVQLGGERTVSGSLILGIDTQSNNASTGVTAYAADPSTGEIRTSFGGSTGAGFFDTGSNGLFFAPSSSGLTACTGSYAGWYCPAQTASLSATNAGTLGSPSGPVTFAIGNAASLLGTANNVFSDLGGSSPQGSAFDFGLPFFFGQSLFGGIEGTSSNLGTGPYVAY
jgi:hypothetical protein